MNKRMPVVFAGHGSPMNAIEDNQWSRGFTELGQMLPKPKAILCVSAHWYGNGTFLTANEQPKTLHDFYGFPDALNDVQYPAPGDPELAECIRDLIGGDAVLDMDWGLDHGAWSVLRWMYPDADIPVIQLGMDRNLSEREHVEIGRKLKPLRDEGVLILGSGNAVHNLRDAFARMHKGNTETPGWAHRYDERTKLALTRHDMDMLLELSESSDGQLAHPSPEHWLPLLYVAAAADSEDEVQFPMEGFDWGSLSMRNVVLG